MNKFFIISGILLMMTFSLNVFAGYTNGEICANNSECNSGYCAQGFCCNPSECGYNNSCYNLNDSYNIPGAFGGTDHVCTSYGWKLGYAEGCLNDSECVTGRCLNEVCCNADECGSRAGGTSCRIIGENFMSWVCVSEGTYKTRNGYGCENDTECASEYCLNNTCQSPDYPLNHSCNLSLECASDYCAQGVCCNMSQCGQYNRCFNINQTYQIGMSTRRICTSEGWMMDYSSSCSSNESCVTGRCINGACCNQDQCAMAYMSPLFCMNVGEEMRVSASQIRACVSEGVWVTKTTNGYACTNDTECASNNCADGICCNMSQCGHYDKCFNINETYQTGMRNRKICTDEGWKLDYSQACTDNETCVTGKCINRACCNADECAYAYMSPVICVGPGAEIRYGPSQNWTCVSEGTWLKKTYNGYACTNDSDCFSGYCFNNTCTESSCQNLWWFDNENNESCGYKEFCGEYMYYGLMTFQNESDCLMELKGVDCIEEGGTAIVYPGAAECCADLTAITPTTVENGVCAMPSAGASICTRCGDGTCGIGENWCNCLADCPEENATCADEGEIPQWVITTPNGTGGYYKDCCQGLMKVLDWGYDSDCNKTRTWANAVCVKECGDGVCTTGETKCTCPEDCPECRNLWYFDDENNWECGYKEFCGAYMYQGLQTFENQSDCVNNLPCHYLYWYDNDNNESCGYKKFCSAYMYYGLRTFMNESDCLLDLKGVDCIEEGGTAIVYPGAAQCCQGLTPISPAIVENGVCAMPSAGASVCTICGNGICGVGENWCNCETDCLNESCRFLYWFDEENDWECGYKEFCGAYMYQGLQTFENQSDCENSLSCRFLWWFDDETTSCGYKEFCGEYMYYGLQTFETEEECVDALPCPEEVLIWASGEGSFEDSHGMQLWVDGVLKAEWNALDMWKQYSYEIDLSECMVHEVDIVNLEEDKTLTVFQVMVGCDVFTPTNPLVLYDRSIDSTPFDGIDVVSGRTEMIWPGALRFTYIPPGCDLECTLVGDLPPCGVIDLEEVIALILDWSDGKATLGDVISLINAWKEG